LSLAFSLQFGGTYDNCMISTFPRPRAEEAAPSAKKSNGAKTMKEKFTDQFFSHVESSPMPEEMNFGQSELRPTREKQSNEKKRRILLFNKQHFTEINMHNAIGGH
jgi:hypothetical protein